MIVIKGSASTEEIGQLLFYALDKMMPAHDRNEMIRMAIERTHLDIDELFPDERKVQE